jgi:hypothetical protein
LNYFHGARAAMEDILEESIDLKEVCTHGLSILTNTAKKKALRYMAGPPISEDDLKTLVKSESIAATTLRKNPALARIIHE